MRTDVARSLPGYVDNPWFFAVQRILCSLKSEWIRWPSATTPKFDQFFEYFLHIRDGHVLSLGAGSPMDPIKPL